MLEGTSLETGQGVGTGAHTGQGTGTGAQIRLGVGTGIGHRGIFCVLQTQFSCLHCRVKSVL